MRQGSAFLLTLGRADEGKDDGSRGKIMGEMEWFAEDLYPNGCLSFETTCLPEHILL